MPRLSPKEAEERQFVADNALATMRLEGLEPASAAKQFVEKYVAGDLSAEELFGAIERLFSER